MEKTPDSVNKSGLSAAADPEPVFQMLEGIGFRRKGFILLQIDLIGIGAAVRPYAAACGQAVKQQLGELPFWGYF